MRARVRVAGLLGSSILAGAIGAVAVAAPANAATTCRATYQNNPFPGGFSANVTVTNNGTTTITGWRVRWTWRGTEFITSASGAFVSQSGSNVQASNMSNVAINPGGGTAFSIQGRVSSGTAATPRSLSCTPE